MTPTEIELRVAAAQATLNRFKDKPLKLGTNDCVRMAAFHLRKLGHQVKLPPSGAYRSVRTALSQLKERGFDTLAEAVDAMGFERIPPAAAVAGDLLTMPATDSLGALFVALGNGRVIGFHQDARGAAVLQPIEFGNAWRVTLKAGRIPALIP